MNKYILIQNDGEIETNSFELIGASTKRNQEGKIGFFGSGLKYSIAYMMRNGIDFRVFSGETEIKFTTMGEILKDQTFDRICINGRPTSYTTTMGPTWTEDWFVFREIYCNALDESGCQIVRETENVNPVSGKTRIYISITAKLRQLSDSWDNHFSMDRTPLCVVHNAYTSFLGTSDGAKNNQQTVKIYHKTNGVLFRKGIRVHSNDSQAFDYEVEYADINEDRTAKHSSALGYMFVDLMAKFPTEEYVKTILRTAEEEEKCDEYCDLDTTRHEHGFSEKWVGFSHQCLLVVKELAGKFAAQISTTTKEVFYIPAYFARPMKKKLPEVSILGMGRSIGNVGMSDIDPTVKMSFLLKEVVSALKQMNYEVPYPISIVQFDQSEILGHADISKKEIYISDTVFDMGRREVAMTLIEETEHIKSGAYDESRKFQTHLISSWLTSMENSNGLFL